MLNKEEIKPKEENKPNKPFGLDDIKRAIPKLTNLHSDLSEYEMGLKKDDNDLNVAINKLGGALTLLNKYHRENRDDRD